MKSIQAEYDEKTKRISVQETATEEDWVSVCHKFNDDVSRIRDVTDVADYTGLYECFDDDNNQFYYLVKEDKSLYRMRRKHFLDNIGI